MTPGSFCPTFGMMSFGLSTPCLSESASGNGLGLSLSRIATCGQVSGKAEAGRSVAHGSGSDL
jgi:hypothetical protein